MLLGALLRKLRNQIGKHRSRILATIKPELAFLRVFGEVLRGHADVCSADGALQLREEALD